MIWVSERCMLARRVSLVMDRFVEMSARLSSSLFGGMGKTIVLSDVCEQEVGRFIELSGSVVVEGVGELIQSCLTAFGLCGRCMMGRRDGGHRRDSGM
jgi:hypothetical protein